MNRIGHGWINGFIGVLIFSASLPATRVAVMGFDPIFLTSVRATIAALLALVLLTINREKRPDREQIVPLIIVTFGVVIGFPLLTALALQHITASYSIVFIGLLPLSTAIFAVLRAGEQLRKPFWVFSYLGSLLVAGFAMTQGVDTSPLGNIYMVAAIIVCGLGYAEGAKLSRILGGWQVISWALILALPAMAPLAIYTMPDTFVDVGQASWIGLIYVSVFSMLIGFVFWYRGLAQGGIAAVGQLQLLQPFFGLVLAAILLHEPIGWATLAVTTAVVLCVFGAKHFSR
ncbi:MAG: DMT family transporter [Rhizobiales bacterium]|nr:DMT family transporter [Hyphomicrobiales bacterium]